MVPAVLKRIADRDGVQLERALAGVDAMCSGSTSAKRSPLTAPTFKELGTDWTSGDLAKRHRDHVKMKRSARADVGRLVKHVYPIVEDVLVTDFSLDHAEAVMRSLPDALSPASRRHVAQIMHRLLALAVYPLRLIKVNPLPKGFLPKLPEGKAKPFLYPAEDRLLLAAAVVPVSFRIFYGFLMREGCRSASEALAMTRRDFDLAHGAVALDENKTDDPRAWALTPGVPEAVAAWLALREGEGETVGEDDPVFVLRDIDGEPVSVEHAAARFRAHLQAAGVTRPNLFETTAVRRPVWLHDARATFVTLSLANGRSETWVADRTGHKSSTMIYRYKRAARMASELALGSLRRLDEAIPELAPYLGHDGAPKATASGSASGGGSGDPVAVSGARVSSKKKPLVAPVGFEPTRPSGPRILNPKGRSQAYPDLPPEPRAAVESRHEGPRTATAACSSEGAACAPAQPPRR